MDIEFSQVSCEAHNVAMLFQLKAASCLHSDAGEVLRWIHTQFIYYNCTSEVQHMSILVTQKSIVLVRTSLHDISRLHKCRILAYLGIKWYY